MSEDSDHRPDIAVETEPSSCFAGFVRDVYAAALDRVPTPAEIAEQLVHLEGGLTPQDFLASVLQSEERQAVVAARMRLSPRDPAGVDSQARFVELAYRAVLGREADADGLANHSASLANGLSPTDLLATLDASNEAAARRAAASRPTFDMEGFVRATFEAILHRPPEDSAVTPFADALRETMDLEGFVRGLYNSSEGLALQARHGAAQLNASCVSLTLFLEAMLRRRGMVLDLGTPPAGDLPPAGAERLLTRLARTIEMLISEEANA